MRKFLPSLAVLLVASASALAADPCGNPPPAAAEYLKAHPGWRILRLADLIDDDKPFWKQYHKRQCPGMAEVDFDGSRNKYVGLALIRSEGDKTSERVVAVRINVGGLESRTIYDDFKAPPYTVVFQVGPGITWEWDQPNKKIRIPHDSLVAATIEAAAQQFYLKDGKFRYVQTSD